MYFIHIEKGEFMKFSVLTLGCKVNQYESQVIIKELTDLGYNYTENDKNLDVCIINSCTVTANSDKKTRGILHRIRRENPSCIIVLTGCMTQAFPNRNEELSEADIILGNTRRKNIGDIIERFKNTGERIIEVNEHRHGEAFEEMSIEKFEGKTRAFIKIEDGCDRFCSYCIIPYARGRVRSKSLEQIKSEVSALAENGHKEVVLVGINLSSYGKETGLSLSDAVSAACSADGIERVRLGSLEPDLMTEEAIEKLAAEKKLCPQFHISLQSGCDETLKRMNRKYLSADYMALVKALRKNFSDCAITTDVMVGFAGETEEEFKASYEFVKGVGFARIHVFAYSRRAGTRAYDFPSQLSNAVKEQRSRTMSKLGAESMNCFLNSQVGETMPVLFEQPADNGMFEGYTPNYTKVLVKGENLHGKILNVKITDVCKDYVIGNLE